MQFEGIPLMFKLLGLQDGALRLQELEELFSTAPSK